MNLDAIRKNAQIVISQGKAMKAVVEMAEALDELPALEAALGEKMKLKEDLENDLKAIQEDINIAGQSVAGILQDAKADAAKIVSAAEQKAAGMIAEASRVQADVEAKVLGLNKKLEELAAEAHAYVVGNKELADAKRKAEKELADLKGKADKFKNSILKGLGL